MKRLLPVLLVLFAACAFSAEVKISELPAGSTLTGTEAIPMVQSSTTKKTNPAAIKAYTFTAPISAQVPDSTATGGNARGANSVDWQRLRDQADQVASGDYSIISGGNANKATGGGAAVLGGYGNVASNSYAIAGGEASIAGGIGAVALGLHVTADGAGSSVHGSYASDMGVYGSNIHGVQSSAGYQKNTSHRILLLSAESSSDTPVILTDSGDRAYLLPQIPSIGEMTAKVLATSADGAYVASFEVAATWSYDGVAENSPAFIGTPDVTVLESSYPISNPEIQVGVGAGQITLTYIGDDGTGGTYGGVSLVTTKIDSTVLGYAED